MTMEAPLEGMVVKEARLVEMAAKVVAVEVILDMMAPLVMVRR